MIDKKTEPETSTEQAETESQPMYFGRFTRGTWRGGLIGIAFHYFLLGILGALNESFTLNINNLLENPIFTYTLLVVFAFIGGKIGSHLEKKQQEKQE